MSARGNARRRASPRGPDFVARPGTPAATIGPVETRWSDTGRPTGISPVALLPLRIFLGVTFLYAGLDKLLDPAFLNASGPGSIGAQMVAFAHSSPVGPLVVAFGEPFPVAVGLGISLAEIVVGLGTLTGLLFRASAALGALLAILFWLTASWAVKPYYYGPDLPYAVGWITLALAGTGGMFTIGAWLPAPGPARTPRELERLRLDDGAGQTDPRAGRGRDEASRPRSGCSRWRRDPPGVGGGAAGSDRTTTRVGVDGVERVERVERVEWVGHTPTDPRCLGRGELRAGGGSGDPAADRHGHRQRQPRLTRSPPWLRRSDDRRSERRAAAAEWQARRVRPDLHPRRLRGRVRPVVESADLPMPRSDVRSETWRPGHRGPDRPAADRPADPRRSGHRGDPVDDVNGPARVG